MLGDTRFMYFDDGFIMQTILTCQGGKITLKGRVIFFKESERVELAEECYILVQHHTGNQI